MKILQVITLGHELYGAQKHVYDISQALDKAGHQVLVIAGTSGVLTKGISDLNIEVVHLPSLVREISPIKDITAYKELKKQIENFNADIVHCHSSKAGILTRLAARSVKVPCVFTSHGWSFADNIPNPQRSVFRVIERIIGKYTDRIITVAKTDEKLGLKNNIIDAHKISTVYNGSNFKTAPPFKTRALPIHLVMVAGFRPQKDHSTLLYSLKNCLDLDWKCTLIGDGVDYEKTKSLVKNLGLNDRIVLTGAIPNTQVSEILDNAHILALISHWEGLPISLIEGMAKGLALIATRLAGTPELIEDGVNGFLVENSDIASVTKSIRQLIKNPDLLQQMGESSRSKYEDSFTIEQCCQGILAVYNELTKNA